MRKREIGSASFARGYRLTPISEDEVAIRPEWVKFTTDIPVTYDRIVLSIDPAVTAKATADASAFAVLGQCGTRIDCLAASARRVAAPELVMMIAEFDRQWQPDVILFESNAAFAALKDLHVRHASFGAKVKGVVQTREKAARVNVFAVAVENGNFRLNGDGTQRELFDEMTTFPFGEHDDLLVTVPYVDLRRSTILKFRLGLFGVESVEHEVDHGQFDEGLRRSDTFLPVFGQPSALAQPREGPLHHPADR